MPRPLPASADSSPPQPSGPAVQDDGMAIIAKNCTPIAPLASTLHARFKIGILQSQVRDAPDFLEPMAAEELNRWEAGD